MSGTFTCHPFLPLLIGQWQMGDGLFQMDGGAFIIFQYQVDMGELRVDFADLQGACFFDQVFARPFFFVLNSVQVGDLLNGRAVCRGDGKRLFCCGKSFVIPVFLLKKVALF